MTQSTLNNLHPNEYNEALHCHPCADKLDRCVGRCNNLNDLSNKVYVPIKTIYLNLGVFNKITGINESKTLTKHMSCEYKCKLCGRSCNPDQWWKNNKCPCECKKRHVCEKDYV